MYMRIYLHELCDITVVLFLNLTWKSIVFFPTPFVFFSAVSPWYLAGRRAFPEENHRSPPEVWLFVGSHFARLVEGEDVFLASERCRFTGKMVGKAFRLGAP